MVIDLVEILLGEKEEIEISPCFHREESSRLCILIDKGELNIAKEGARSISGKDQISIGASLDVGSLALFDEVNSIQRITLHEYIVAFAGFDWLELRSQGCHKSSRLILEVLDSVELVCVHYIRELDTQLRW